MGTPQTKATSTLPEYQCADCGASGVKLWRLYNTFLEYQELTCCNCSAKAEKKTIVSISDVGMMQLEGSDFESDQIGYRIPAVPTAGNDTYWSYTSVPQDRVEWWKNLPNTT